MKSNISPQYNYERVVLENVSDIIVITDLDFYVQSWNPVAEYYYDISSTAAIGSCMSDLVKFSYLHTTLEQAFADLQKHKIWQGEVSFSESL